jgi:hypothetical protein
MSKRHLEHSTDVASDGSVCETSAHTGDDFAVYVEKWTLDDGAREYINVSVHARDDNASVAVQSHGDLPGCRPFVAVIVRTETGDEVTLFLGVTEAERLLEAMTEALAVEV